MIFSNENRQGESSKAPRKLGNAIPTQQLANLFRAIGFYPTELEIRNIFAEVLKNFADPSLVTFEEMLKLYINHRPVNGISKVEITKAFEQLNATENGLPLRQLLEYLKNHGEKMTSEEISECFTALIGDGKLDKALDIQITPKIFAEDILGFQDYEQQ